ncbi:MAG: dihydrofolate reductase family protein [Solirubrobacterales bacterium]|nr:dihydrofolate reductase family protein [Solirubrobacterales bacterium]
MLADGLVDDLHLFVFPSKLGSGQRLFADGRHVTIVLAETETYDSGALHLTYQPTS